MIAYNYYIKFIPELKNDKKAEGSFIDVVTVQESSLKNLPEALTHKMTFFNNQNRDVTFFTEREFARTQRGQQWAFGVKDVVTFFWHSGTLKLEYIKHRYFTEKLLEYWSLHTLLPIFLAIEEIYDFLHAGAVEVDGQPVLFIANSFGGKSTMIDFFLKKGHTVISDDKVASYIKSGQLFSVPSHPHHRPHRRVEDLGFFIPNFANTIKPIYAIFELVSAESDDPIEITEIKGVEKFKSLRYSSEITFHFLREKRFGFLVQAAKLVPLFQVSVPWNLDRLAEVHHRIVEHVKTMQRNKS